MGKAYSRKEEELDDKDKEKIYDLYTNHEVTITNISKRFNRNPMTISNIIKEVRSKKESVEA